MAPRKTERLVNLTIALLSTRRYLPRERIRELVEGYHGLSDAAFQRTFERDKDELRAMGVPIGTGTSDPLFEDEPGYRIVRADFELPPVEFTPAEAAALGAAGRVWQQASTAEQTLAALAKLRAAGIEPDIGRLGALDAHINAREPAFDPLWWATLARQRVGFHYRGAEAERVVQPWSLTWRHGSWYVLGYDEGRAAPRVFKLARITQGPRLIGGRDAYQVPADVDLHELTRGLEASGDGQEAVIAIQDDAAPSLRRRGVRVDTDVRLPEGFTAYRISSPSETELLGEICAAGADVLVIEPIELRRAAYRHAQAMITTGWGESGQ